MKRFVDIVSLCSRHRRWSKVDLVALPLPRMSFSITSTCHFMFQGRRLEEIGPQLPSVNWLESGLRSRLIAIRRSLFARLLLLVATRLLSEPRLRNSLSPLTASGCFAFHSSTVTNRRLIFRRRKAASLFTSRWRRFFHATRPRADS